MTTSANKIYYNIYDKDKNLIERDIGFHFYCKFPLSRFKKYTPLKDFYYTTWWYDEDEVYHEDEDLKPLNECENLIRELLPSIRLCDPMNYKETCYWIVFQQCGDGQREHLEKKKNVEYVLAWLGSNAGQWYIECVNKLIDEYPYKEEYTSAIICGKVYNHEIVDGHKEWILNKLGY
jgi:hypothetical protein